MISPEEYLEIDRESDIRYEYDNGRMYAMAGGTQDHEQICFNKSRSKPRPYSSCEIYFSSRSC
jgi:Uma2 family endonuclease